MQQSLFRLDIPSMEIRYISNWCLISFYPYEYEEVKGTPQEADIYPRQILQ